MLQYLQSQLSPAFLAMVAVALIVAYVIKSCFLSHPSYLPPMPCTPLPIIGHLLFCKPSLEETLMRWRKTTGKIFTCYFGPRRAVVISDHKLLHQAFVKNADNFADRIVDYPCGLVNSNGSVWTEHRTLTISILKDLGVGKSILAEKVLDEIDSFLEVVKVSNGEPMNMVSLSSNAFSNVILRILVGTHFDYNDPLLVDILRSKEEMLHNMESESMLLLFPLLQHLPGDFFQVNKLMQAKEDMQAHFCDYFIKKFKDEADDTTNDNYIKAYLREMKKRTDAGKDTHLEVKNLAAVLEDLFFGGSDTSAVTFLWSLICLIHYPEVQGKIHAELEEVVGTSRTVNIMDRPKMNYLNAFIMETQRFCTVTPVGLFHMCSRATKLGDYTIPANTIVVPHMEGISFDKESWKDPEVFRPDRFLDENKKVVVPKQFIPFSSGRRACPGEWLAKMELFLFLGTVCQRYDVLPENANTLPSLDKHYGMVTWPEPFSPRLRDRTNL